MHTPSSDADGAQMHYVPAGAPAVRPSKKLQQYKEMHPKYKEIQERKEMYVVIFLHTPLVDAGGAQMHDVGAPAVRPQQISTNKIFFSTGNALQIYHSTANSGHMDDADARRCRRRPRCETLKTIPAI